ncbi:MAG: site-specific integrase [Alicyclobacillus macrosporangiidus]|nr:site-specific integrase [Alicyclobacillus macrosporangiidus]
MDLGRDENGKRRQTWFSGCALERADVPRIRFHDLRHTHASLMLAQGVHPKIVSERLGHSSISITMDTYSHLIPGLQHRAADDFLPPRIVSVRYHQ